MFARKIKSVFFHGKQSSRKSSHPIRNIKVLFKTNKNNMKFLEVGTIKQRIDKQVHIVQGPKNTHKRNMNQLRKCRLNESKESPQIISITASIRIGAGSMRKYSADGADQAGFGVVGGYVGDVLYVWPNEVVQWVHVKGGGRPVREGYKVVALLLKTSLALFGLVGRRRVLLPHQGSATRGSEHSSAHPGTLWCWLSSWLRRCEVGWCGPHLKPY